MHRVRIGGLCLFLIAMAPAMSAQDVGFYNPESPTPTTMYLHLNDIQDAPINTQRPADGYFSSGDIGLAQHSQGCFEVPNLGLVSGARHTTYGFSSPGYVQYDIDEGGKPRYHNERGISYDVELDPSQPVELWWHMESQVLSGDTDPSPNQAPVAIPQVVVQATIREGDDISVGKTAYNEGAIIAQGVTQPTLLLGPATDSPDVTYTSFEDRHLYSFRVELPIERSTIPKDESFNVRIDVYQANGVCEDPGNDAYVMADLLRTHTSPGFRPHFTWTVMNPLRIERLHPQFIGDELIVHGAVNSPWGNYDVAGDAAYDTGSMPSLTITGPTTPLGVQTLVHGADPTIHGHHGNAVVMVWGWDYRAQDATDGIYTVVMDAANDQGTAMAQAVAQFQLGAQRDVVCAGADPDCDPGPDLLPQGKDSPGIGAMALLGVLAAAGAALRRR